MADQRIAFLIVGKDDLSDILKNVGRGLDDVDEKSKSAGAGLTGFGAIAQGALERVGHIATDALASAGQAVVNFATSSISAAGDFEASLNTFASVVGDGMASAGLATSDFQQLFLDMGAETQFSAAQASAAAIELAKGGRSAAAIMGGELAGTLGLAAAGGLELASAANITAKQLGVWGDTGVTAANVADTLAQAANASTVDVEELALGLANVGGVAKLAGASFRDTVTTMAMLSPGFSSAADAGTSLKVVLSRLIPSTDSQASAMAKLGLLTAEGNSVFYDAQGNFIGMRAAAEKLKVATDGMGNAQKQAALQVIFGQDAIRAAAIMAEKGAKGFDEMGAAMLAAGSAAEQAAARNRGFNFALESLGGSVETLQIVLGSALLPALTSIVMDGLIPAVNAVTTFVQATQAGQGPIAAVAGFLQTAFIPAITGTTAALAAYALVQTAQAIPAILASLPAIAASIVAFEAQALAVAAAAAPYALVAAAVAGVTWAWQDFSAKYGNATQQLLESRAWWNDSTAALQAYQGASEQVRAGAEQKAAALELVRTKLEAEIDGMAKADAAGLLNDAQRLQRMQTINSLANTVSVLTGQINAEIQANAQAAAAATTATAQLAAMEVGNQELIPTVALTAEEIEKLGEAIQKTYQKGGEALQKFATTEVAFLAGVEERRTAHEEKIGALIKEKEAAKTEAQRTEIDARIAAETAAYRTQEEAAATSYARQQSAQQAHLGQMLIDYTTQQAMLGNIGKEKAAQLTEALVKEYGIQENASSAAFLRMAGSIDEWAGSTTSSTGEVISALRGQQQAAVETEAAMQKASREYVTTVVGNFVEKGGEANAYAGRLRDIPKEVNTVVRTKYVQEGTPPGDHGGNAGGAGSGGRAIGGSVAAGEAYMVGERGRELFVPDQAGQIITASQTDSLLRALGSGQGSGTTINYSPTYYNAGERNPTDDLRMVQMMMS